MKTLPRRLALRIVLRPLLSWRRAWWLSCVLPSLLFGSVTGTATAATRCPEAPLIRLQALLPDVWIVPGAPGDADAGNRGAISNLLLVRQGRQVWLLGSGPTAAWGRALDCAIRARLGRGVSDVIAPWPRPELVLGQSGLRAPRHWAHADVAAAMRERCRHCIERLRLRLGHAADDLQGTEVALPDHLLQGANGRLGPFLWWRLERSAGTAVTVWRLAAAPLWSAHGLLWADGAPDLRDADLAGLQAATRSLTTLAAMDGARVRWLPEQGPLQDADAPARHLQYWSALERAVSAAFLAGAAETDPPTQLSELPAETALGPRHALNWQRVWRAGESRWLAPGAADLPAAPR